MDSLVDLLRAAAKTYASNRAVVFGDRVVDFATFDRLSDSAAAGLVARGIERGDRVGLYCVNGDAFPIAYFGILKAGATVVPVNLLLNPKEVAYILNDAGARALIYHEAMTAAVRGVHVPGVECRVSIGANKAQASDVAWSDLLSSHAPTLPRSHAPDGDLAAILYTSGTTGYPKGAMLTHRNLASNVASIREALKLEPGKDVLLVVLPMFHAFAATVGMLFPLLNGCTMIPLAKFDPQLVADTIEKHQVTVLPAVPSMYNVLLRLPDEQVKKFASLKYCVSGGAALPAEIMQQFEAKFGRLIYEGDGPTECSPCTAVNPIGGKRKLNSIGPTVPNVEMEIRDEHGAELPLTQIGEICVRGPNVMKGYWNRPEDTKESFFGEWFRTGDLGYEDEDGYFFIVDRKKDMIIVNGMNVYPRIIEEVLHKHPAVKEAAVVGEPDPLHGEIAVAFVTLKDGAQATGPDLRAFCRENLGRHEIPRKVFFMAALPRNAAGKILKRELRKQGELERGVDSRIGEM
ncbi:MAG: long-chain fatty acid--CoA ligase [bacterium]